MSERLEKRPIPLFDLGNVVIKVDFAPFVEWLTARSEAKDPDRARALLRSSLFVDLEFGDISREEFARRLRGLYKADFTQAELEERFCAIFPGEVAGMSEVLRELASEGPLYCLSNTNEIHLSHIRERHPELLSPFKRIFASHEIRARKPYPGVYRGVADALGVAPGRLVFFDDVQANVEGALRAGLEAYLFLESEQVRSLLNDRGEMADNKNYGG